ncbi:MAG: hypothetical protein WA191_04745, partial [Telluria sp.]
AAASTPAKPTRKKSGTDPGCLEIIPKNRGLSPIFLGPSLFRHATQLGINRASEAKLRYSSVCALQ